MNKNLLIIVLGVGALLLISGGSYFFLAPKCPVSCDDGNSCTTETCSKETSYKCKIEPVPNCCGNKSCETAETYDTCAIDCPTCDDNNKCTKDSFDYNKQACKNLPILDAACCGNTVCETGENYQNCARDCVSCDDDNKCTKDSYDYNKRACLNKIITPCCGNQICDAGAEAYASCSLDCPNCDDGSRLTKDSFNYKTQKCEYIATHYFIDDFETAAKNWDFFGDQGPTLTAWGTTVIGGNTVLRGTGHYWANLRGKEWTDYIFKTKFKAVKWGDGIHFNFRNKMGERNPTRYFIGVGSGHLYVAKQIGDKFFNNLVEASPISLDSGWHTFEIRGRGNIINIYIDGELLIKYKDTASPILSGGVAFETLDNAEFLIDDVEVRVISEKDIVYP
ncbi:hypothetical protein A2926_02530 [Candidatus Giovannonibacteria bacterium RIFCSPLOWO2_01_FULL_44_40]|nr:MAG: hypothetical protein A3C77_02835 [Candidatus Giovannonibacteria bacterium RIFCSPHIGHO2_02_FULL_45_13]OGF79569.1 MAG: hypothetical protein A2926_02530 [Candidatus Giovannonibacteria bacterium RIFCSPLOWO2_01_FULL_44_40]